MASRRGLQEQKQQKQRQKHKEDVYLRKLRSCFRDNIEMVEIITPLVDCGLISLDESSRIDRGGTNEQQVDILNQILVEKTHPVLKQLIQVLESNHHSHVKAIICREWKACSNKGKNYLEDSSDSDSTPRSCRGSGQIVRLKEPSRLSPAIAVVPEEIMRSIQNLWTLPLEASQGEVDLRQKLAIAKNGSGMILLTLQRTMKQCYQEDTDRALEQAKGCLDAAAQQENPQKRKHLVALCLTVISLVHRMAKRLGKAQSFVDRARQDLDCSTNRECEVIAKFTDGRLAMDMFLMNGFKDHKRKAIDIFCEVLNILQQAPDEAENYWWPSIHQQCLLNMALIYLGYPGSEPRCQELITPEDVNNAHKCVTLIKSNRHLMDTMDPRTHCHLIRTEGDLFFREQLFPQAIDKLTEAKITAEDNGFKIDVKYCDLHLNAIRGLANKAPQNITLSADMKDYDADVSHSESSEEDCLKEIPITI